jgi:hypothetical protein
MPQARKKTTTNIGSRRIAICNCNVKKQMKPPLWRGKLFLKNKEPLQINGSRTPGTDVMIF